MYRNFVIDTEEGAIDLIPLFSGEETCKPRHCFGPYIREHCILHFCLKGKGMLYDKKGAHSVQRGEFFIIHAGEVTRYEADAEDPWHYIWLAFRGSFCERMKALPSVCKTPGDVSQRLEALIHEGVCSPDAYRALLYELAYGIFSKSESEQDPLSRVRRHVRYHYMEKLSVESLSREFGFERSYLYRIFKKRYGLGLKEYIIKVRMEHAKDFLSKGIHVSKAARLVGYTDEFNFSRAYKKFYSKSPKADKCKL